MLLISLEHLARKFFCGFGSYRDQSIQQRAMTIGNCASRFQNCEHADEEKNTVKG
jgi:hypothetical protein